MKLIYSLLALSCAASAWAQSETRTLLGETVIAINPNGKYLATENNGNVSIFDLDSDSRWDYVGNSKAYYMVGNGNAWGNDMLVGCVDMTGGSAVWKNGRWLKLQLAATDPAGFGNANGITPNGSRICGNASTGAGISLDESHLMVYPCYWDQLSTGAYGKQTGLPHPTTDFVGETPQYVTALTISPNGKTICGQVTSNNGFMHELIVYTQDSVGNWSYSLPLRHLINPNKIEVPENPGEGPEVPSMESFLTDEQLAKYDEAAALYYENPEKYPLPKYEDYMTAEQIAAYNEAIKPLLEWQEKYEKYYSAVAQIMRESPDFCFNLVVTSENGRYIAMARAITRSTSPDAMPTNYYIPYIYDTMSGEVTACENLGMSTAVTSVNNNGDILAYQSAGDTELGMVRINATGQWMKLGEYLVARDPSLQAWVKQNWEHNVEAVIDVNTGETDFIDLEITGIPFASADWTTFASFAYNFWGGDGMNAYLTYVVRLDPNVNGIPTISTPASATPACYDLQGRRVSNPRHGIFIVNGQKQRMN